jgi:hypothetical protein
MQLPATLVTFSPARSLLDVLEQRDAVLDVIAALAQASDARGAGTGRARTRAREPD